MSIPTIRLDETDTEKVVKELRAACVDVGFFYIEGHGIAPELLEDVFRASKELFALPVEEKKALSDPVMSRGYTAMQEETLDPSKQRIGDTKEGFYIGKDVPKDSEEYNPAKLAGPNMWPSESLSPSMEDCDGFKETMNRYRAACSRVGLEVVRMLAQAIGLDDAHFFDQAFSNPIATTRLLHYADHKSDPEDGVFACGAHTDYGMITLLLTDENAGLQIRQLDGSWLDVPPKPQAFVFNLGDMVERWTNGLFRSTLHRVLTTNGAERYSIPFFYDPHFDTVVKVLDVCCSKENPPKYPPTTTGQHLLDKYKETHADFQPQDEP